MSRRRADELAADEALKRIPEGVDGGQRITEALAHYRERLLRELGDKVDSVLLYGSRARGDAGQESDIDLLIVLRERFDYGEMLDRTSDATAEVSLEYDIVISRVFVSRQDYQSKKTPFLINVRREAVEI